MRKTVFAGLAACALLPFAVHAQSLAPGSLTAADTESGRTLEAPVDTRPAADKFWWSDDWFERGQLPVPVNHEVARSETRVANPADRTEAPAIVFRPKTGGAFPAVLFLHGRRGLDDLAERVAIRIAARGFVVMAPDLFSARFIEAMPVAHDPATEKDAEAALDALLARSDVATRRACIVAHTRGGYLALRLAVAQKRQQDGLACLAAFYPHWQSPSAPEPDQVYRYAGEVDALSLPTLVMIGEYEQYQRRRSIETAVLAMKQSGRDVRLIIYPGVGRGFEFRGANVRTFADDLATKDAIERIAAFMRGHLGRSNK